MGGDAGEDGDWPGDRLTALREELDQIDQRLVQVLEERFRVTREVGRLKAEVGLPPVDIAREERILARLGTVARRAHLDPELLRGIYRRIFDTVVAEHRAAGRRP
ncbi:MAG: chorismate mutase [Candidatus Dormibacteraeota bacterium]|nr:chorismate mutase [Candidatus Dormibacteraeota bacterium]MBO0745923.1 chorismate mutase [Candidatus Dormibacteraeota bacterium]